MAKEQKTNAMRILDSMKVPYIVNLYTCDEFIDGVHIADMLGQPYESSFKTLVAVGKSGEHYVFVLPIAEELDFKKCAQAVGEKAVELIAVKDILKLTGYVRGGCTPIGMKKAYPTVIHESALNYERIIISGGRIGAQILLDPRDLAKVTNAEFRDLIR
ncbi:MAG: Cys-tRNA(Pro) deacylase [Eubacteriales bacterium]